MVPLPSKLGRYKGSSFPRSFNRPHNCRMETCDTTDDDATALKARRERLRILAAQVAEVVESIAMPDTFLEAERAARTLTVADRMILRLSPDEPESVKPARQRLRVYAHRLLAAIENLTLPVTFLEGERASRCVLATDRMLSQLYEAPRTEGARGELPGFVGGESRQTGSQIHRKPFR